MIHTVLIVLLSIKEPGGIHIITTPTLMEFTHQPLTVKVSTGVIGNAITIP